MRTAVAAREEGSDQDAAEKDFQQADVGFHEAKALASGNRLLTYLFEAMAAALQEAVVASPVGHRLRIQSLHHSLDVHSQILHFVGAGDERRAADAMTALLDTAKADLRAVFGGVA